MPRNTRTAPPSNTRLTPTPNAPAAPSTPSVRRMSGLGSSLRRTLAEHFAALRTRIDRPVRAAGRALVVLACVAGSVAVARLVERHVRTSPAFATREIRIEGRARLTEREVLEAAGLAIGRNAFETGPEQAAERLRDHPWIASAHVERRLPGHFVVKVRERRAVAVLALGALYLVSEDGAVFKRVTAGDPVDLPVITGVERERFTADRAWRTSLLLEVVALLHSYREAGLQRSTPVGEVHVEPDGGLSLYVGGDALHARLGRAPFREKLSRLRRVLDRLAQDKQQAAYVYLDNVRHPDRVTVRLVGDPLAGAAPVPGPTPVSAAN
jgi:cell division protein FtsQ